MKQAINTPIAVIDMGTNTFLLLIGSIEEGKPTIHYREQRFVRLDKGGISDGQIAADAIQRGIDCLTYYKQKAIEYRAASITAVATSALRNAKNQEDVSARFVKETGISPIIIDGATEAQLIYEGIRYSLPQTSERLMAMDIGGGSVEFIIGEHERILWKRSFEIGAQRLFDRFFTADPLPHEEEQKLMNYLNEQLKPLHEAFQTYQPTLFVGSAGTFDTLWDLKAGKLGDFPPQRLLLKSDFLHVQQLLLQNKQASRLAMPGMIDKRVDLIVVASCIVRHIFNTFGFEQVTIAAGALKEGAFLRIAQQQPIDNA